jgi:hypothetical protein
MSSRTYNPLHFEDLEPKRFEDLVRQLAYDFRNWSEIEATGRSGNDGGFDVRAWEKVPTSDDEDDTKQDQPWLIQCKREKTIGPTKAEGYAKDILKENKDLYGVLFVASCNLSKDTRDKLRGVLAEEGVQEVRIWSGAELEDQLFQPKNDNLLFAYFGFSLAHRKQSQKTKIKAKLATKKKMQKIFGKRPHQQILVRDVEYKKYPNLNKKEFKGTDLPIKDMQILGYYHDGIILGDDRYHAYIDNEKKEYDIEDRYNQMHLSSHQSDFYNDHDDAPKNRMAFFDYHRDTVPHEKKYYYLNICALPYDSIVDVDEEGDEYCSNPHIYVNRLPTGKIFARPKHPAIHRHDNFLNLQMFEEQKYKRIKFFPKVYKAEKPKQEPPTQKLDTKEKPFPGLNK